MATPSRKIKTPSMTSGFKTPYVNFDFRSKVAFWASVQSYFYDPKMILRNFSEADARLIYKYRSNDNVRKNFTVVHKGVSRLFEYLSEDSTDQCAVYKFKNMLVFGFRGTDTVDPMRYLKFIPKDYDLHIARSLVYPDISVGDIMKGEIATYDAVGNEVSHRKLDISPEEFARELNKFENSKFRTRGTPVLNMSDSRQNCPCNIVSCPSTKQNKTITRETILDGLNAQICTIGIVPASTTITRAKGQVINELDNISGGGFASDYSDCASDIRVAIFAGTNITSRYSLVDSSNRGDIKHVKAYEHAQKILDKYPLKIALCCGHSLGGSLAMHTHLKFRETELAGASLVHYFVGFNPAIIRNFQSRISAITRDAGSLRKFQNTTITYRNLSDMVSNGVIGYGLDVINPYGSVPTFTYRKENDTSTNEGKNSDTLTHGLWTFGETGCKSKIFRIDPPLNLERELRILDSDPYII